MDGYPKAPGDEADDLVAGQRVTAAGKLNQTVVHALYQHAVGHPAPGFRRGRRRQLRLLLRRGALLQPLGLLFNAGQHLPKLNASIADGGIKVILCGAVVPLAHTLDHILHQLGRQLNIAPFKLPLQLRLAFYNVFVPLFLLKPGADLVAGLAGAHQGEPVPVGSLARLLGGEDFNDLPGLHFIIQGHNALIHLGANHPVAHSTVNGIGKVDDRGAQGQVDHIPFRGEHKDLFRNEIALNGVDQIGDILAFRLVFQHLANPGQAVV